MTRLVWLRAMPSGHVHAWDWTTSGAPSPALCGRTFARRTGDYPPECKRCLACVEAAS